MGLHLVSFRSQKLSLFAFCLCTMGFGLWEFHLAASSFILIFYYFISYLNLVLKLNSVIHYHIGLAVIAMGLHLVSFRSQKLSLFAFCLCTMGFGLWEFHLAASLFLSNIIQFYILRTFYYLFLLSFSMIDLLLFNFLNDFSIFCYCFFFIISRIIKNFIYYV